MNATVETIQPDGAVCEIYTDEPLVIVGARLRAYGVQGVHVEQRGRRRWLVANALPVQPADHVHIEDDTPATRRSQQAEVVALIGAAIVAAGLLAGAMGMWI